MTLGLRAAVAGVALGFVSPAFAQTARSDVADRDDIVVTAAPLHGLSLGVLGAADTFETPFSVQSITADTVKNRGIENLTDFRNLDPSAQPDFRAYGYTFQLRGFEVNTNNLRLDGVPAPFGSQFPLEFVDHTDILRGASGFLYGFGSPGGIVNFVLKRPTTDALTQIEAKYVSNEVFGGSLDVSRRFGSRGQFAIRVNGTGEYGQDWQQDNVRRRYAGSVAAEWRVTDNLLLQGDYTYQNFNPKSGSYPAVFSGGGTDETVFDPTKRYGQKWGKDDVTLQTYGVSARFNFASNWNVTVQARGARQDLDIFLPLIFLDAPVAPSVRSTTYSTGVYGFDELNRNDFVQTSLSGKFKTGPVDHQITLAADYQRERTGMTVPFFTFAGFAQPISMPGIVYPKPVATPYGPLIASPTQTQYSALAADKITWNSWILLVAARYAKLDITGTRSVEKVSPTIGLVRQLGPRASIYASYAKSLEPGGTAPFFTANAGQVLAPVISDQYEVGAKFEVLKSLVLTLAAFRIDRAGEYVDTNNIFRNDATERHDGAEFTVNGMVTDRWLIVGGASYLDPKIDGAQNVSINGRVQGLAKFQTSLYSEYQVVKDVYLTGGVYYTGNRTQGLEAFTTADIGARATAEVGGRKLTFTAIVQNVFNRIEWGSYSTIYGYGLGIPRNVKLSVRTAF